MFAGRTSLFRSPARRALRYRAGLGLVEAMVALAITAALLTAVAGAFTAAAEAIKENDEFFQATQTGRVALTRILTQVRRGSVDDQSTATSLHLVTDTGVDVRYTYDAANKIIQMIIHSNGVDTTYMLARNVNTCTFATQTGTDYAGNPCISRVAVSIAIQVDNNQVLLSGTGTSRALLAY